MDHISPKDLKGTSKKYNLGGAVMPIDVQDELASFKEALNDPNVADVDKEFFRKAIANIEQKYPSISKEILYEDAIQGSISDLVNGNWYKKNPSKLLGVQKIEKSRYGNDVTILKGDISVLESIDAETDFGKFILNRAIGVSQIKDSVRVTMVQPDIESFVQDIVKKSTTEIGKKAVTKRKKEVVGEAVTERQIPIQTYKDIYAKLNRAISIEELKVYIWYKDQINQRLSQEWYYIAYEEADNRTAEQKKLDWLSNGILFYHNGKFLPLPIFASGNMYEKVSRLVKAGDNSGQDIEYIVTNFGERVLQLHLDALNNAYDKIYKNRLTITGNDDENSLILKPISKFARTLKINRTESFEQFKWWSSKGKPDFSKTDGSSWRMDTFDELSLTDAFSLWITENRAKMDFKGSISYYDVIYFYIDKRTKQAPQYLEGAELAKWRAQLERTKAKASSEGNRLFLKFLKEELSLEQKVYIETNWNATYNNYLKPDYSKIPVAFNITNRFFDEEPFEVKEEKREAVSFIFNEGSGCLAYDVGVGKSLSAIMIMEQFIVAGYSKRPFLVVPNQTYKQWLSEIKNALPHRKVNGLFNLGVEYSEKVKNADGQVQMVDEGSISVLTYEGFLRLGFNEQTQASLLNSLYEILNQGGAEELMSAKKKASFFEKLEGLVGKGLKGSYIEIESLGFDFVCYDEAHALKKIFTSVKGEAKEGEKKAKKSYDLQAGQPSDTALKGFMISNYILKKNNDRNILLLTATPFTNSPLEVFSMLSLVAYHHLDELGILNINDFFDNYIDVQSDLVINHKLKPQYKQIVKGFNNLPSLQKIIFRFFNYKDGDDVGVIRPNKIVIPYVKKLVNGEIVRLSENEQVTSSVEMSGIQKKYMDQVIQYAEGAIELDINSADVGEEVVNKDAITNEDSVELSDNSLSDKEKQGVRALRAMNFSRNIALSPYLYEFNTLGKPTYTDYVNTSPKLKYVMECIRSVKEYHESHEEPVSGQVIYMDRGLDYFNMLRDYLIYEVGFQAHEVGEITARMSTDKKRLVQDTFLGRYYDEKLQDYQPLEDSKRIKVLLGSSSIKEGINLQTKSTVLYNCFLDWNPTDIIQLEGRVWRQKNEFMNVRIVNPLVIDSIDIFMFQKLEEKTARINSIWSQNNKSVLKLEEIDPEEIKFALIKNPRVIAELEVETKGAKIQDEIASLKSINDRLKELKDAILYYNNYQKEVDEVLEEYLPSKLSLAYDQKVMALVKLYKDEYPKDDSGRVMIDRYDRQNRYAELVKKFGSDGISPKDPPYERWWFKSLLEKKRLIEKETRDLLNPRNLTVNDIESTIDKNNADSVKFEEEIKYLKSEDYVNKRSAEITDIREKNKITIKDIDELVNEFSRLNYLLSIKRVKSPSAPIKNVDKILVKLSQAFNLLS
jgi:hypothetical protein